MLGFFYAPVNVFPYLALYPAGWINGKLPTEWIFSVYVTLLCGKRHHRLLSTKSFQFLLHQLCHFLSCVLLPKSHIINTCFIYYLFHSIYYGVALIGPPPLLYFAYQNQTDVKIRLWKVGMDVHLPLSLDNWT